MNRPPPDSIIKWWPLFTEQTRAEIRVYADACVAPVTAERDALRKALLRCLQHWLRDDNPEELQGTVEHIKHLCGWDAAIDAARKA